jgi:signal peptidase I
MMRNAQLQEAGCDLVEEVARSSGKVHLKVNGASMVPALWPGDLLTIRSCELSELRPGTIIAFRHNQGLIVHRLMQRSGERITTRGDALPAYDEPVVAAEVVGRVETVMRNGRLVDPQLSLWQKAIASVLRHSEWCTWFFLRFSSRMRKMGIVGAAFGQ